MGTGSAQRSWYWGPAPFAFLTENYADASGGSRQVAYYDKSRMEINNPRGDRDSKWYVTNGLLVKEMISGQIQAGDNRFRSSQPAEIPVSGDGPNENTVSPTYASFGDLTGVASRTSQPVSAKLSRYGTVSNDSSLANRYPETAAAYYSPELGHNIPGVLWRFLNLQGSVLKDRRLVNERIEDWLFSFGLPITEAYWTRSKVAGVEKDVLVQLFERRVLTYTPSNSADFQVEMGNVGMHYYNWRYSDYNPKPGAAPTSSQAPARLNIPAIGVSAQIEYVGLKGDGTMDVPLGPYDVAWYRFGPDVGDVGNAVIAGHLDYYSTGKAVFWDLGKLKTGDVIEVSSVLGNKLRFQVTNTQVYPDNNFPSDLVFGSTSQRHLNLITCQGSFDSASASYNKRLVVFTTLIS